MVVHLNVRQILDSPLAKKLGLTERLGEVLRNQADAQLILADLGFDPFRDIDSVTVATPNLSEMDKGVAVIHGKFDVAKFQARAEDAARGVRDGLKVRKISDDLGGHTRFLYEVTVPDQQQPLYVKLVNQSTLVVSPGKEYVLEALDKEDGRRKTAFKNKDLLDLLARVDSKQSMWAAVRGSTLARSPLGMDNIAQDLVRKVKEVTAAITVDEDVRVVVNVTANKAEDAMNVQEAMGNYLDQARGILAFVASDNHELRTLLDVVRAVKPSVKDKTVTVEAVFPGPAIERAVPKP
jgi:hypothetical protein